MCNVINSQDTEPDWKQYGPNITKIVVGRTPGDSDEKKAPVRIANLSVDLRSHFPNLTHLYLWGIEGLESLPELPTTLKCLDLRGCKELKGLPELPASLETLDLGGCSGLKEMPGPAGREMPRLLDVKLNGCPGLPETWIHLLMQQASALRTVDASECPQITRMPYWPPELVDARFNKCASLKALPAWPKKLRRLELAGAKAITKLPDFHDNLDYINLAGMERLTQLPAKRGRPRTLFLFGSGLLMPPASELGENPNENVAARTEAYFEDVALTGQGEVKGCKVLMMGNGGAGKTCLSLALTPGRSPAEAEALGSTQGVQFIDWTLLANVGGVLEPVHLYIWDFGGQEIYHNTHRLFMSKGAVFILLWNPDQDGKQPEPAPCGYQDEWRPLQYWLDFIQMACPHKPRIAIVCSHRSKQTPELEKQWRGQVREEFHEECKCFYIDSKHGLGELEDLKGWLGDEVGGVIHTQGVAVPTYWEIAQDMVAGWVERMDKDKDFATAHNQMHPDRFKEALWEAVATATRNDKAGRYIRLKDAIGSGNFDLTPDRLTRTLSFLTHSGWLYWNERLFEGRVIIGQKWALDGIYAILDRRQDAPIFRALAGRDGRFTLSQLGEWVWTRAGYSTTEQELLLSFIQKCGLCFKLRERAETWREEDVYVSFEHLPIEKELRLQRKFYNRLPDLNIAEKTLECPQMHKLHWQAFLTDAGSHYGKDAEYTADSFYLENAEGGRVLVLRYPKKNGLGGEITIRVGGPKASERLGLVKTQVEGFFPSEAAKPVSDPQQNLGAREGKVPVAISYAWNPPGKEGDTGIPPGYEVPVDAIENFLKDKPVIFVRDRSATQFGTDLKKFMEFLGRQDHMIMVHSDKYWKSQFCIFEIFTLDDGLRHRLKTLMQVLIPVEHLNSGITNEGGLKQLLAFWSAFSEHDKNTLLEWDTEKLKINAQFILHRFSADLARLKDLNLKWSDGPDKVLRTIAERLNFPQPRRRE